MDSNNLIIPSPAGDGLLNDLVPDISTLIDEQLMRSGRLGSNNTVRAYRDDLRRFHAWRQDRPITKSLVEEYMRHLSDLKRSPNYLTRCLASIRWYIRAIKDIIYDNDEISRSVSGKRRAELLERADRALLAQKPRGERACGIERGRYISLNEFIKLMSCCSIEGSHAGIRDRAMFALAYSTGPRVHEIAGLKLKDVYRVHGDELIYQLRIIGKGNKERPVPPILAAGAARYLQDWIRVRGQEPGALFCYITRAGNHSGGELRRLDIHMSTDALARILRGRRRQAGLEYMTWHDFRRTYISDLINEYDLVTAQKIIGHSSTNVTAKYDRSWREKAKKAAYMRALDYSP